MTEIYRPGAHGGQTVLEVHPNSNAIAALPVVQVQIALYLNGKSALFLSNCLLTTST